MLHHPSLVLLSLLFLSCFAQEHLTCVRSTTPAAGSPLVAQGPPGMKGVKGEPCPPNNSELDQLRDEVAALRREVTAVASGQAGFQRLGDGWFGLFNGHQYKLSSRRQNYASSRQFCKSVEADLAVYGMQDPNSRRIIYQAFGFGTLSAGAYIGLDDMREEGTFRWLGSRLLGSNVRNFWRGGPDGGTRQNCVVIGWADDRVADVNCLGAFYALCEKRWT